MIIYKTTNQINGKIYIGKDGNNNKYYYGSGVYLQKAIKKYGRQNFKKEILEYCTVENINEREVYWIKKLNSINRKIGYNITNGGTGGLIGKDNPFYGKKHTKDSVEKISKSKIGCSAWNKGLTIEDDRVKRNRDKRKKTIKANKLFNKGIYNPMFGRKRSDKEKSLSGNRIYIYDVEGQQFNSLKDISKNLNLKWNSLRNKFRNDIKEITIKNIKIERIYK